MLALSGVTNGRIATEGFRALQERCGVPLADLAERSEETRITFQDTQVQPRRVITSPEWSGIDEAGRALCGVHDQRRAPQAVAHAVGAHALYLDHEWMLEYGEALPAYRPAAGLPAACSRAAEPVVRDGIPEIQLRYLTPHSKWSIHSEYQDNLHMLTLFRGGSGIWMNPDDAARDRRARQRLDRGLQPQRRGRDAARSSRTASRAGCACSTTPRTATSTPRAARSPARGAAPRTR